MRRRHCCGVLIALALFDGLPTHAQEPQAQREAVDDDPYDRPGWYGGVGGAFVAHLFEKQLEDDLQRLVDITQSGGLNGRIGYRVASWFALEAEFEWVSGFDVNTQAGQTVLNVEAYTYTANAKIIAPLWRSQPYLLLGIGGSTYKFEDKGLGPFLAAVGGADFDTTRTAVAGRVGLGIDGYITENWLLFAECSAVLTTFDITDPISNRQVTDLYYLSATAGMQYRF